MPDTALPSDEYFAGLFDGEGCVSIVRHARRNKNGTTPTHSVSVEMTHTFLPCLQWLQVRFGGSISATKARVSGHKPKWSWKLGHAEGVACMGVLRPLLREKAYQAWLALEFDAQRSIVTTSYMNKNRKDGGMILLTAEEVALRDGFYWALRGAKRGY